MSINHLTYQGNLTRDPELRVTTGGTAVCSFSVAHNKKWRDEQGNQKERVCFLECTAWGKTGEMIAKWFAKGGQIIVEGELELDEWEDKTTKERRSRIKLNVGKVHFCGDTGIKKDAHSPANQGSSAPAPRPQQSNSGRPAYTPQENLDEDVPF